MAQRRFPRTIAAALLCACAAACGRLGSLADSTCALGFGVTPDSVSLGSGETTKLRALVSGACYRSVSWKSKDTTIAVVSWLPGDSALVRGVRPGTTIIYGQPIAEWGIWTQTPVTVNGPSEQVVK